MPAFVARYAEAFAEVVTSLKLDSQAIDRQLTDVLATWDHSRELREFFVNPAFAEAQKLAVLDKLKDRMGLQKELRNLIAVLIHNDRIGHLGQVAAAYRRILEDQRGIRPAEIVTARELGAEERDRLLAEVTRLAGSQVVASFKLDKSILGGTVVRIGSTVYDGSVRGRLERLRESLIAG
jgi:F-type H+-transporting ATPase subunit delta